MSGTVLVGAILASAPPASAAGGFTGTWVQDLASQKMPRMVDVYRVQDGEYRCDSCTPPRRYPADGQPHPVPGDPDVTSESVAVTGPRTIVTHIDSPAMKRTTTMTVAPDGQSATYVSVDERPGVDHPLRTEYVARRTANGPPAAHPVSGTWRGVRYVRVPVEVRTVKLEDDGARFAYAAPLVGVSFTAAYGGPAVVVEGPYGGRIRAAVARLGARRIRETRTEDGKVTLVRTYTLSPDGRALAIATFDAAKGTTFRVTAHRAQP